MRAFGGFQESGINASSPNTWAATHRWNVSWSQFPHCAIPSPEIHASLRKFLLSPRSLWDSSLPPRSPFVVECHQCSDDHMLLCDQKTFLTHSVGLQINSSPEKPRRKISLEKNLDIQILEEGLFCLISEQLNPQTPKGGSGAIEWTSFGVSSQQDDWHPLSTLGRFPRCQGQARHPGKASH